jgi:hypothetical protein
LEDGDVNGILRGKYGEQLQIRRQSPAFIGDMWTYVSWRAHPDKTIVSGAQEYVTNGNERMRVLTGELPIDRMLEGMTMKERRAEIQKLIDGHLLGGSVDSPEANTLMKDFYDQLPEEAEIMVGGTLQKIKPREEYLEEYSRWMGTGLRFELLRYGLDAGDEGAIAKGKDLLERIVELQPGRIFLKSIKIQERLAGRIEALNNQHKESISVGEVVEQLRRDYVAANNGAEPSEADMSRFRTEASEAGHDSRRSISKNVMMQKVQENLLHLERLMYNNREQILAKGHTFDGKLEELQGRRRFSLHNVHEWFGEGGEGGANPGSLPNPEAWDATQDFMRIMREDFATYADHHGEWHEHGGHRDFTYQEEGYYQEFIQNREYNHAYTLWSGDSPIDEFNMGGTGASGAFARRAGENQSTGEANNMIIGFLGEMGNFQTADEIYNQLSGIYTKIKDYDLSMAKKTVTFLAEAACKMYAATGTANAPLGDLFIDRYWWPKLFDGIGSLATTLKLPGNKKIKQKMTALGDATTGSLAQRLWDNPRAMVWHPTDMRYLIVDKLMKHGKITPEQKNELVNHVTARSWDALFDKANTIGPLLAIAMTIYILKKASEDV